VTLLAVSTGGAILAWVGLVLGLVIAIVVVALLQSVLRPVLEIRRYADDILAAGVGIAKNLDPVDELGHTHELAQAVPGLAVAYLNTLQDGAP
jgi:hypothetical protein